MEPCARRGFPLWRGALNKTNMAMKLNHVVVPGSRRVAAAALAVLLMGGAGQPPKPALADSPAKPASEKKKYELAENWKLEVLAEHPAIHHPSVVFPAPDGRIFLAEDPMDMKGSSRDPADRILVIHPDGKITVFAEGLYAVFGMQYIDGKLYVHHTPKFSVFTDKDSVGVDRVDLLDCTNPSPNGDGHGFNDHIPSNCRLGMDGYLYISSGDKGIYGARSKVDGSAAEIHGGGVFRMRPDGSQLETYVTGTRNHLDVGLNAEDELFTYDNTDDGLGWWTRLTHEVDGGFYGYPFDYRPPESDKEELPAWEAERSAADKAMQEWEKANHDKPEGQKSPKPPEAYSQPFRPWTLWRMYETGGGSATGSVCYNEDALPAEYHGNIFCSDWGKGNLERFVIERAGGTYKVLLRQTILSKDASPFRPVGIQALPDGSGLLVADWNYNGWRNANVDAGRLLKLTFTGKLTPAPRPTWWVAAAQGQPFQATDAELIAALSHPAQSVRLVAQRRIADRGAQAVPALTALVGDASAPPYARWHAIWALDRIDGGQSSQGAIIAVLQDPHADPSVRMQAARQLGTRKVKGAVAALVAALNEPDEALRFRAATALGRIGELAGVQPLIDRLDDKDLFAHYAIFKALSRIGSADPRAWKLIVAGLASDRREIRDGVALSMHETYDAALVKELAAMIESTGNTAEARAAAIAAIAPLQKQRKPWAPTLLDQQWWGTMPARNPAPPKIAEWAGAPVVMVALKSALNDGEPVVVRAAVQGLKFAPDPSVSDVLAKLFEADKDVATRQSILAALAAAQSPATVKFVDAILSNAAADDALFASALQAAETTGGPEMTAAVVKFVAADNTPAHLCAALESLARLPDVKSLPVLTRRLADNDETVSNAAADAIGAINDDKAVDATAPFLKSDRPQVQRAAANALGLLHRAGIIPPLLAVWREPAVQKEAMLAMAARPDIRALDVYLDGLSHTDGAVRGKCRRAIDNIHDKALPLIEARLSTDPLPARTVAELKSIYDRFVPDEKKATSKLYQFDTRSLAPEAFLAFAKSHPGNAANGRKIFSNPSGVGCIKCHKVAGQGGEVGPSLDGVGGKYPRDFLVDSILYPSKQILDGYQQTLIKRKDGDVVQGIVRADTDAAVTLVDAAGQKIVVPKTDIALRKVSNISLMPEGLQTALQPEEFADVIAYLESLKEGGKEPAKK